MQVATCHHLRARRSPSRLQIQIMRRQKGRCISKEPSDEAGQLEKRRLSFAQHLPIEILSTTFLLSIPTSYTSSADAVTIQQWRTFFSSVFPMNLTGVCRSWRQAALCTRALWSTFLLTDSQFLPQSPVHGGMLREAVPSSFRRLHSKVRYSIRRNARVHSCL